MTAAIGDSSPGVRGKTASLAVGRPVNRLYGRDHELGLLTDLLSRDAGGALIIRGEPGIGKSALLAAVIARAREQGALVLTAVGVQSEARLGFAGLHQLLRPVLHLAERLPAPQRAALLGAFGMSEGAVPEIFLIGLATLGVIGDAADTSPVLVVADDAQWLDEPSRAVLAFVARRLAAEPALMLVAAREGLASPFDEAALPELRLSGLTEAAARDLLASRAPGLEPVLRERLIEDAAGNPLALVELPDVLCTGRADEGLPWPRLPLTARLERAFAAQGSGLPAAARSVLLVAAADEGDVLQEILDAASVIEGTRVTADAMAPAVAARLVTVSHSRLVFRHPLVRSATYQAASPSHRRAAHAALAEVLADQPDRRVWHRAAATLGPDEQVAAELDEAAARAGRRGAARVAIDALTGAAELSMSPASRPAAGRTRRVRRTRPCSPGRAGTPGAARRRGVKQAPGSRCLGSADAAGAPDRAPGRRWSVEPGNRSAALHLAPHRRRAPAPDLPEARSYLPQPAPRGDLAVTCASA